MNFVDVLIVALVLLAIVDGATSGLLVTLAKYAGAGAGLLGGALLAAAIIDGFEIDRTAAGFVLAASSVLALATIGYMVGILIGTPLRERLTTSWLSGSLDAVGGAIVSATVLLFAAWTVASIFALGPNTATAQLVQQSTLVRKFTLVAPDPPAFIVRLQQSIASNVGPNVFGGLEPALPRALGIDRSTATTSGVLAAAADVVRIESGGCGGTLYGSGIPISADEVLTNAHVLAGASETGARTVDGQLHAAQLVLFDPIRDVAVLRVPGLDARGMEFASGDRGTTGAIIGYPGGGAERVTAAVIDGVVTANGTDIYGDGHITRNVWVVEGSVLPGNSGGPFVDTSGKVVGMIFSRSLSDPNRGFALTPEELKPDLDALAAGEPPFDHANYRCGP